MKVLVEEALSFPLVVAMDLVVEVVDMVADSFKNSKKKATILSRRERVRSCRENCRLL
jgi:hypothetical protein